MPRIIPLVVVTLFLFALSQTASSKTCSTAFEEVLKLHTSAIDARNLDAYMDTLAPRDEHLMILPDGTLWESAAAIRKGHASWFSDTTWRFNKTRVRKDVRAGWGLVVYEVTVDRPGKPGEPFLLSMLFAPEEDGCWYLQHDQNTLLPASPSKD